ncbi:MAG: Ig-like domain-containing protein [Clostridiales bacterium]|nr:Ig-like domain-containing protein [Clostridiales bacterium]
MKRKFSIFLLVTTLIISLVLPEGKAKAMTSTKDGVMNKNYLELDLGASFKLAINGATAKQVKFSSSNKEVATVKGDGTITAVSEGDYMILPSATEFIKVYDEEGNEVINTCVGSSTF